MFTVTYAWKSSFPEAHVGILAVRKVSNPALHALTSLYGQFTDTSVSTHWIMAIVQGLIAVGFFMAGKASMTATTS